MRLTSAPSPTVCNYILLRMSETGIVTVGANSSAWHGHAIAGRRKHLWHC